MHAYRYDISVNIPSEPIWNAVILKVAEFVAIHNRSVLPSEMFLRRNKELAKKRILTISNFFFQMSIFEFCKS